MRVGLHIGKFDWEGSPDNIGERLGEIAKTADENGFYSIWTMDHLFQLGTQYGTIHGPVEATMLEGYSTIAYMAALTTRIKVGLMVTCNFFREPGLLIKTVSTIDVLSGGRTYFGIGAGWFEREAKGLGFAFPSLRERFERLEETLQIAKQMWRGDVTPYNGKYHHLAEPINNPQPLSKPHPPILIGGEGEKRTLRLVAEYADASNFVIGTTLKEAGVLYKEDTEDRREMVRAWILGKLAVLKRHCNEVGRPYNDIEKTLTTYIKLAPDAMNTTQVIELCRLLAMTGIQHVIFNMPNVHEIEPIKIVGEKIIPQVTDL
ncbi:MAG: LLM class F420-dependent oxidoreductase [Candidatus Bathyarchaeota archaeon]|nr:LLM class F420-dependent oxidoreductase [Candidatus Bathyarchaeota archaeon]MDH5787270.1 LLM class F420-dependent oxidoreductase [Candidatus Bathyarchaeota archaeon]